MRKYLEKMRREKIVRKFHDKIMRKSTLKIANFSKQM